MSGLRPVAFDIETTGLDSCARITVAGLASDAGAWLLLNTNGREACAATLETALGRCRPTNIRVAVSHDEASLLESLNRIVDGAIDGDHQYLTAYNGELWRGGFDLPVLRRACIRQHVDWPFTDLAYADLRVVLERIATEDATGLDTVYDALVGGHHGDPFSDSADAVEAFEAGAWEPLLRHNLADIDRTLELAVLVGKYVPRSDFRMKNLDPPDG